MLAYQVGDSYFFSVYLALNEAMKTGKQVSFYCKDADYDKLDWTKEPEQSFDELMTAHAFDLRNRHDRLILGWSGGTDSHTIYRIFKQNNIHIDEILIKTSKHLEPYPEHHFSWLKKHHYDKDTIITKWDQNDTYLRGLDCIDENWMYKNKGDLLVFGNTSVAEAVKHLIEKNHAGKKWIYITGFEKPRLVYRNGKWYSRQLDSTLRQAMGYEYIDSFFLEPLIHLKQSHLIKRAVKEKISKNKLPLYDEDWAESKWPCRTRDGYRQWAQACGRDLELTDGTSSLQKIHLEQYISLDISKESNYKEILKNPDPTLKGYLGIEDKTALNYIKGFFNIYSEKKFMEFLNNNYLKQKNQIINISAIWSKSYDLGY